MDEKLSKLFDDFEDMCEKEASKIFAFYKDNTGDFDSELFELKHNKIKIDCITNKNKEKKSGIYIFIVSSKFTINCDEFDSVTYAAKTNDRLKKNTFIENDCFYLGKSESDILGRISEHLNNETTKTYSLRLNSESREFVINKIHLFTFVLKDDFIKYKKLLLPTIESYLHELLKPKVGSKRT